MTMESVIEWDHNHLKLKTPEGWYKVNVKGEETFAYLMNHDTSNGIPIVEMKGIGAHKVRVKCMTESKFDILDFPELKFIYWEPESGWYSSAKNQPIFLHRIPNKSFGIGADSNKFETYTVDPDTGWTAIGKLSEIQFSNRIFNLTTSLHQGGPLTTKLAKVSGALHYYMTQIGLFQEQEVVVSNEAFLSLVQREIGHLCPVRSL